MSLLSQKFLFLDCQTTGMRPTSSSLLELGWSIGSAAEPGAVESRILRLPEGGFIPARVQEITGIREAMLEEGLAEGELFSFFEGSRASAAEAPALVHYAQFERAFLEDLYTRYEKPLPFPFLCTYRIARKLFPAVPSRNIRGVLGYLGFSFRDIKRADAHVRATMDVWSGLVPELEKLGITDLVSLHTWLEEKPAKKKGAPAVKYEYRVDKIKRLELPAKPGVYRMLSKSGDILYVGKATCLKDRVNSYFRGKKGRDPRKLELMAQVWDLDVTECGSPLEAALLESDEIKRLDPPYNVSLKTGRRQLYFYRRDFSERGLVSGEEFPMGPFRGANAIEQVRQLLKGADTERFKGVFYELVEPELLEAGYRIFAEKHLANLPNPSLRQMIALGLREFRRWQRELAASEGQAEDSLLAAVAEFAEAAADADGTGAPEEITEELPEETPEGVADRLDRVLLRAGLDYLRAKALTRLLNAEVRWEHGDSERVLRFRNGRMTELETAAIQPPWQNLDIRDYDRMSVLLTEVRKGNYRVTLSGAGAPAQFS